MKKLSISIIALAAISSASIASDRSYELRDSDTYFGKYSTQLKNSHVATNAFAVDKTQGTYSNFERMKKIAEEIENGGH